jgi:CRP-like cAMP-binding protein
MLKLLSPQSPAAMVFDRRSVIATRSPSALLGPAKIERFRRGDILPNRPDQAWQIITGYVRSLTWTVDGELTTLGIWGQEDWLDPDLSIVVPYQVECLTTVTAVLCPALPIAQRYEILLNSAQQTEKLLAIASHRQVYDRLRALLDWLAQRFGRTTHEGKLLAIRLTHQQLAELAGTTRVTATRLINQLEREGWIQRLPQYQILIRRSGTITDPN